MKSLATQDLSASSELAWIATIKDDQDTAREIFHDLGTKVAIDVWEDKKTFFEVRNNAYAR